MPRVPRTRTRRDGDDPRPEPEQAPTQTSLSDIIRIVEPACAAFRRRLKSEGLRYTPERARILDAVIAREAPFQAEDLIDELRRADAPTAGRVSKATVYRTIKLLQDVGVIQQVLVDADQAHYQVAWGQRPQALLVRTDTRELLQIDAPELAALVDRLCAARGLTTRAHRLVIYADAGEAEGKAAVNPTQRDTR